VRAAALSIAPAVLPAGTVKQIERAKETERILSILHQWGIHTLGQLAALPRDDLAARSERARLNCGNAPMAGRSEF
jgi:hypothetical protein